MLLYQSRGVRVGESWFGENLDGVACDIYRFRHHPVPIPCANPEEACTLLLDLSRDEDGLLTACESQTRRAIRLTMQIGDISCGYEAPITDDIFTAFCDYHDQFAAERQLQPADRVILARMRDAGVLDISFARDTAGETLVYHASYLNTARIRIIYSASFFKQNADKEYRALVARANRWLHWTDMLRCKAMGVAHYDFGGWYDGDADQVLLQVNRFKESFGGTVMREYSGEIARTITGKIALYMRDTWRSART